MQHTDEQSRDGVEAREAEHDAPSDERMDRPRAVTIFVNAVAHTVTEREISFDGVVALASGLPTGPNILYSVSYQRGHGEKPTGTLVAGGTTKVKHEMIFSVTATDRS